jgi:hypothetical protein
MADALVRSTAITRSVMSTVQNLDHIVDITLRMMERCWVLIGARVAANADHHAGRDVYGAKP